MGEACCTDHKPEKDHMKATPCRNDCQNDLAKACLNKLPLLPSSQRGQQDLSSDNQHTVQKGERPAVGSEQSAGPSFVGACPRAQPAAFCNCLQQQAFACAE